MDKLIKVNIIPFEWNQEVYFHPETNELEYRFRGIGFAKYTYMYIKINPNTREIEYIQTHAPVICGDTIQYPVNLDYNNIMKDYDNMIEICRDDK